MIKTTDAQNDRTVIAFTMSVVNQGSKSYFYLNMVRTYSATCRRVLDCSALYDCAMQNTSPQAGMAVSKYN